MSEDETILRDLLVRAAPPFDPIEGEGVRNHATERVAGRPRRLTMQVAAAAIVVAIAIVATIVGRARSSTTAGPVGGAQFRVRLVLPGTTFPADGTPIQAYVIATNHTGQPIEPSGGECRMWFVAGLSGAHVRFEPVIAAGRCPPARESDITRTVFRQSVTIDTTYADCQEGPYPASAEAPRCTSSSAGPMPPLPPGTYTVRLRAIGGSPEPTLPSPEHITLTRAPHR